MNSKQPAAGPTSPASAGRDEAVKVHGRYCVIIPAYDAEASIGALVKRIKELGLTVLVVDDGSRDKTALAASRSGALVLSHLKNRGKGSALRTAFQYALRSQYDGVVTVDSDGQHAPADVLRLIQAGERQHAALVIGNRFADGASSMPADRRQTNRWMSAFIAAVIRQPVADSQCGLRMARKELLASVNLKAQRFEIETELILAAARQKWKTIYVPVQAIYNNSPSHIHPFPDALRFLWTIGRFYFMPRSRPTPPAGKG